MSRSARHPDPPALETDDVKLVGVGTALWAVGLVVLLVLKATGNEDVRDWWLGMCGYGIALGLFGMRYCRKRHQAIERDAARGVPRRS